MPDSLQPLVSAIEQLPIHDKIVSQLKNKQSVEVVSAVGSLTSLLVCQWFRTINEPFLFVFETADELEQARLDFSQLLPNGSVLTFPEKRKSRWGHDDTQVLALQAEVIQSIISNETKIILTSAKALTIPIQSQKNIKDNIIILKSQEESDFEILVECLVSADYARQMMVEKPGDFAVRGGIIDVFPYAADNPIRVEFWGNVIESIRFFDVQDQRSLRTIDNVEILPKPIRDDGESAKLVDVLSDQTIVFYDNTPVLSNILSELGFDNVADKSAINSNKNNQLNRFLSVYFTTIKGHFSAHKFKIGGRHHKPYNGRIKDLASDLIENKNKNAHATNFFLCESESHAEQVTELLAEYGVDENIIRVLSQGLDNGFSLPEYGINVYTDHEFFGRVRRRLLPKRFRDGLTPKKLKAMNTGDFVVHTDHGIGRFRGLSKIKVGGHDQECLVIEYVDDDKLYVRLDRMDRVQKYTAKEGTVPKVHKLGAQDWERLKKRTKSKIKDIARELVQLYALRHAQTGYAFSTDTTWQKDLEASFQFEDTEDQYRSTLEIKKDMEARRPMDRLLCGDVGYGKTEVAIRAAFKAVQDSKQVAMLVPTTILAEQHFLTFSDRLKQYPIRVEVLSRFRKPSEQKEIVRHIETNEVDVIIGTHRLLSKDIKFANLGLLVIDEEQRFGVRHKEKLKQFRANVDVLALSATPIPRTLHMSMLGIRDMSQILTPPRDRLPVHTETVEFDQKVIRQAILSEIQRGGQIFFVHNRVETIYSIASKISELVPEADVTVAHGQMKESELERVMKKFMSREYHVLVATMIIESGLDIPNVNTILINRADKFGLAQLYQLRGRVGRSDKKAFCYLIVPPLKTLTREAIRRLETIEEFTDLGSGFQIAMRDLEIRGAGNVLGGEQSGFIEALGFDAYIKILEDAIEEFKHKEFGSEDEARRLPEECKVEVGVDAYLPDAFVSFAPERVDIYRRLAHAGTVSAINNLQDELRDRFGRLPEDAENLLNLTRLRILGKQNGFAHILHKNEVATLTAAETMTEGNPERVREFIGRIVTRGEREVEFLQTDGLALRLTVGSGTAGMKSLVDFLHMIKENN